ncbi:hypothetical protein LTR78_009117 [Recurvomyces mirabilis]|uniref:Heterokaryon incompatibility domain-containing protein n=1 Tax=Recurvomyces mirabilis TaxID=574656 RepID=A0AAE0TPW3_9PEZI|nr:hypothetical protein LTR78_009117 [Recurvomyces mirabilis]KAK5161055.1 hypothetical protein LTS14_000850 [Recurvomyces mirabilis]
MPSDFELVFGCGPDQIVPPMKTLTYAFGTADQAEHPCVGCLRSGFIGEVVEAASRMRQRAKTDKADPTYVETLFLKYNHLAEDLGPGETSCRFCDFIRTRLKRAVKVDEVKNNLEKTPKLLFYSHNDSDPGMHEYREHTLNLFVSPVGTSSALEYVASFSLAPMLDHRESRSASYPHLLRFSSEHAKDSSAQQRLRDWLKACEQHESCTRHGLLSLPARVIDVGTPKSPALRLHRSRTEERAYYLTLSYCWGGYDDVKLLAGNLEDFQKSIDEHKLPQTYRDVVWMARQLRVRYLWIDAFCIVQNDAMDWKAQSDQMHHIYGNAYLTICASSASSPFDGFLHERGLDGFTHVHVGALSHADVFYPIYLTSDRGGAARSLHHSECGALRYDPLTSRAWAV